PRPHPRRTPFPYTTLFRSQRMPAAAVDVPEGDRIGTRLVAQPGHGLDALGDATARRAHGAKTTEVALDVGGEHRHAGVTESLDQDRKSTRLNSSHVKISYA